jgi:hypothetical protein
MRLFLAVLISAILIVFVSSPLTFAAVPGQVTLAYPENGSTVPKPDPNTLIHRWSSVADATEYEFQLDLLIGATYQTLSPNWVGTATSVGVSGLAEGYQMRYRVRARNLDGNGLWSNYSTYTIGAPLPVQVTSFSAIVEGTSVSLAWRTLSETQNYGFFVERGIDAAGLYTTVSQFIPGHGTTLAPQQYAYTDAAVPDGIWYYRLRQIDMDGSVSYLSSVRVVISRTADVIPSETPTEFSLAQNYPNPFNPATNIAYRTAAASHVKLCVYTMLGEEVATLIDEEQPAGEHSARFFGTNLASGTYLYRLEAGSFIQMKRMVLLK